MGKLFAIEPTWGVSFGLPGGYPQGGGGYPLNPVGNYPLVNPYQSGGIPLGPISVNPLVSFQKSKDKTKTKIWRPLVNLHITPNPHLFKGIKALVKATKGKGGFFGGGGWGAPEYQYGGGYGPYLGGGAPAIPAVPVPYPVPVASGPGLGFQRPVHHHNHDHFHHYQTAHSSPYISRPSYSLASSSSSPFYPGPGPSSISGYSSRPTYGYGSGAGAGAYGYSKGSSPYISSADVSSFYKLDKKGPLDGGNARPTGTGGIFGSTGTSLSQLFSQNPGTKRPGKVSEASGLTPEQESLLEALLKEDEEEKTRSASKFRSDYPNTQYNVKDNKSKSGKIEFIDNKSIKGNSGGGYSAPFSGSKTKFPEEPNTNNIGFGNGKNNDDRSRGIGIPISFPDSRLPPNAASFSASGSSSNSDSSSSSSMFFPNERRSLFQESRVTDTINDESNFRSFTTNDDDDTTTYQQQQGSSVTFPLDTTSTHSRQKREIRTQPPPTATIDGRVLHFENEVRR